MPFTKETWTILWQPASWVVGVIVALYAVTQLKDSPIVAASAFSFAIASMGLGPGLANRKNDK